MKVLLQIFYPLLCIYLPSILYQIVSIRRGSERMKKKYLIWVLVFLFYVFLVLSVTGIGTIWDISKYEQLIRPDQINLRIFQSEGVMTYLLNLIMFMPLGFLLPLIWEAYRSIPRAVLTGFGFSLAIEITQLFNLRASDVDDLIMNTLGAAAGYVIWILFDKIFGKEIAALNKGSIRQSPALYLVLAVLGQFFFYNFRFLAV